MRHRILAVSLVLAVLAAAPAGQTGDGEANAPPRTPWGAPDLRGQWTNATTTPLERPDDLRDTAILTEEERAAREPEFFDRVRYFNYIYEVYMERGGLIRRTSLIVDPPDGRLPPLTPRAQARHDAFVARWQGLHASWEDTNMYERCITRGLPGAMIPGFYNHNYLIVQTPDHVAVQVEMIHDARVIPLDGRPHLPSGIRQWLGDSRGRWEGDTLVVETTNVTPKAEQRAFILVFTALSTGRNLHLEERFTPIDADTIDYRFTVTDPTVYTRPWTAAIPMRRTENPPVRVRLPRGQLLDGARPQRHARRRAAAPGFTLTVSPWRRSITLSVFRQPRMTSRITRRDAQCGHGVRR